MEKIPEIPLVLNPKTEDAKKVVGFEWNDQVGERSKIGGTPDWQQGEEKPICPSPGCGKEMTFYGQFDSVGDSVCLADCGMIYVFVCFDCFETKSILQSG